MDLTGNRLRIVLTEAQADSRQANAAEAIGEAARAIGPAPPRAAI